MVKIPDAISIPHKSVLGPQAAALNENFEYLCKAHNELLEQLRLFFTADVSRGTAEELDEED